MVWFRDLLYDDWNEAHIARHGVESDEVTEAVRNAAFITCSRRGTYHLVGQTDSGRSLAVILASRAYGVYYIVLPREKRHERNNADTEVSKEKMMATGAKTKSRIPDFASIEEGAEFWDTHDLTEFEDELEPVEFEIAKPLKSTWMLSIRIDKETFDALKAIATPKGLGASTLARMWILEELARAQKSEGEAR